MVIYEHHPYNGDMSDPETPWVVRMYRKNGAGEKIYDGLWSDKKGNDKFTKEEARRYAISPQARKQIG